MKKSINWALIFITFTLWLITISSTSIHNLQSDPVSYVKLLPFTYWLGLLLLLTQFIYILLAKDKDHLIEFIFIIMFSLYFAGIQPFIYDNPKFMDINRMYRQSMLFKYDISLIGTGYPYDFPIIMLLGNLLSQILNSSLFDIIKYFPIFISTMSTTVLYSLGKNLSSKFGFIAPILFIISGNLWFSTYYTYTPFSISFLLFLILLLVIIKDFNNKFQRKILGIVLLIVIVSSSPTLSLLAIFIFCFVIINDKFSKDRFSISSMFLILFVIIFFTYVMVISNFIFGEILDVIVTLLKAENSGTISIIPSTPMMSYFLLIILNYLKILMLIVFGIYLTLINRNSFIGKLCIATIALFFPLSIYFGSNSYMIDRPFFLFLIPFSLLIVIFIDQYSIKNKIGIIITIVILLSTSFQLLSGIGDPYSIITTSELYAENFIYKYQESEIIGNKYYPKDFRYSPSVWDQQGYNYYLFRGETYPIMNVKYKMNKIYDVKTLNIYKNYTEN